MIVIPVRKLPRGPTERGHHEDVPVLVGQIASGVGSVTELLDDDRRIYLALLKEQAAKYGLEL